VAGRLEGKVALVTGAGSSGPGFGTGKATSILFAREGARVLLVDNVRERADQTLAAIEAEGGEAAVFAGDIAKAADCEAAVEAAVNRFGSLDTLVNNVGVMRPGDVSHVTEEDWDFVFSVNLKAMMLLSKYASRKMTDAGGGSIVNVASTGAVRPPGGFIAYDTAKGGVIALTISLAVELGRHGIRVNCVQPGRIVTPMVANIVRDMGVDPDDPARQTNRFVNLLGLQGDAWDVASAALFLASDEARWITSVTLPVDGGFLHTPPELRVTPKAVAPTG
jgi:NAD(P)-dependent dehydrogenase (short-subunit alcohol dehydrogenase family)